MPTLPKSPTGVEGLDDITGGGLPRGRLTLICGSAGCGKTILAAHFLLHGALRAGEPGVFFTFEETAEELRQNFGSLGFDFSALVAQRLLAIDYVHIDRSEMEETGEYDLEGLFVRLALAIDSVGAKRVVLDGLEALFSGFSAPSILRAEIRRLFRWLKSRGLTAIITGERAEASLTRHGLEEYVSDCVITLDHRVTEQVSTRRLRVVKYRGSTHGTNEYPFLIHERGVSVLPITSASLDYAASTDRVSSGIAEIDKMLGGGGYYQGSSVLVSGASGTGKSSIAAHFTDATCKRGARCLYVSFEEASHQIIRNMRSIGIDLERWTRKGLLRIEATRPTIFGLETHLLNLQTQLDTFAPDSIVLDPLSSFRTAASHLEVKTMLLRLIDLLKAKGITVLLTSLTSEPNIEATEVGISSLIDTWLHVRDLESEGERNRTLYILKSRGMAHSNQVREFVLSPRGIELLEVCPGPNGILTGSSRVSHAAREETAKMAREHEVQRAQRAFERKRKMLEAQIEMLRAEIAAEEQDLRQATSLERKRTLRAMTERDQAIQSRQRMIRRTQGNVGTKSGEKYS